MFCLIFLPLPFLSFPFLSPLCSPLHRELKGVVISLSSDGHLLCSYMGTDPSFFSTPKVDAREADYEQVDAEMKRLQRFIREATRTQGRSKPNLKKANFNSPKLLPSSTLSFTSRQKMFIKTCSWFKGPIFCSCSCSDSRHFA